MSNYILCRKKFTSLGLAELKQADIKDLTCDNLFFKGSDINYVEIIKNLANLTNTTTYEHLQKINISNFLSLNENIELLIDSNGINFNYQNNLFFLNDKLILQNVNDHNNIIECYIKNITNNKIYIGYHTNISGNYYIKNIIRYELLKQFVYTYEINIEQTPNNLSTIPIFLPLIPLNTTTNRDFLININKNVDINRILLIPAIGQYINGSNNFYNIKHKNSEENNTIYMLSLFFNGNNIWFVI